VTSLERTISTALRVGVTLAALISGTGGVWYLATHGSEPAAFAAPVQPLGGSEQLIALGVLVLIATPVMRVALLVVAFARQRDALYAAVSMLVLVVLLAALL
jgi:uncharacterized membrane protein